MSATSGFYAPAGQGWRLAYSLVTLAHELADVYGDQLTCLGTVGDAAHAAENMSSDHNPFILDPSEPSIGIVRAIDFGGSDALLKSIRQQIWNLYAASDPRVYVFGYGKGCSDNLINNWGLPFATHVDTGDAGHLHVSVTQMNGYTPSPSGYVAAIDSTASWGFDGNDPSGGGTPIPGGNDVGQIDDTPYNLAVIRQGVLGALSGAGGDNPSPLYGAPNPVNWAQWVGDMRGATADSLSGLAAQNAQILAAVNNGNSQTDSALQTLANALQQVNTGSAIDEPTLAADLATSLKASLPAAIVAALAAALQN